MKLAVNLFVMLLFCISVSAQNVGIGTTSPLYKLHIASNLSVPLGVENTGGTGAEIVFSNNSGAGAYIGLFNNNVEVASIGPKNIYFGSTSAYQMVLNSTGNLGIGTLNPASKLHVNGQLSITGNNALEFGQGIVGKEASAGKIGYASFTTNTLDIVGAGTSIGTRKIRFWNEGGAIFEGSIALSSGEITHAQTGSANLIPIAYGTIDGTTGAILSGTGNFSVTRFSTGSYSISISGKSITAANSSCQLSIVSDGTPAYIAGNYSGGNMIIRIVSNDASNRADRNFSFIVHQP